MLSATRSAATPKPSPSVVQSKSCAPIEAIRNVGGELLGHLVGHGQRHAGDEARTPRAEAGLEPGPAPFLSAASDSAIMLK